MGKRGALSYTKKEQKGAVICQKEMSTCDFLCMNSLNDWCRMASLVCCLLLGLEGYWFGHGIMVQARSMGAGSVAVAKAHSNVIEKEKMSLPTKVAIN